MSNEDCEVVDAALAEFPIPDEEDLESNFPATEEAIVPVKSSHGRLLAGLPDRYNW